MSCQPSLVEDPPQLVSRAMLISTSQTGLPLLLEVLPQLVLPKDVQALQAIEEQHLPPPLREGGELAAHHPAVLRDALGAQGVQFLRVCLAKGDHLHPDWQLSAGSMRCSGDRLRGWVAVVRHM